MMIVAHRGASADLPEQSAAAILEAWEQGADGVEVDLRTTADGRLLLHHDATLARCCGDPRRVAALDSRRRAGLNACRSRPELPAEIPLLLEEALELVTPDRQLFLELKEGPEQIVPLAQALAGRHAGLVLISFRLDTLREARRRLPRLQALWLRAGTRPPVPHTLRNWLGQCEGLSLAGLDLEEGRIDEALASRMEERSLALGAWTVDDASVALRLVHCGVGWLTTNRPRELRVALEKKGGAAADKA